MPPNDPEGLADAMEQLLNQKELRLQLARRARNLIETEFDARRNAAQLRRLFTGKGDVA
ncbi:MAG: glycosyltransferase [Desulfobulbus sp.]